LGVAAVGSARRAACSWLDRRAGGSSIAARAAGDAVARDGSLSSVATSPPPADPAGISGVIAAGGTTGPTSGAGAGASCCAGCGAGVIARADDASSLPENTASGVAIAISASSMKPFSER
jgi:hypothetical protein